mmetsp:Transcript_2367/g.8466  ORF Transcript_2367/g.8466 Transcript_2367/m.8466 type:complete len:101 (-) Transcript_2367:62-364(-)
MKGISVEEGIEVLEQLRGCFAEVVGLQDHELCGAADVEPDCAFQRRATVEELLRGVRPQLFDVPSLRRVVEDRVRKGKECNLLFLRNRRTPRFLQEQQQQ